MSKRLACRVCWRPVNVKTAIRELRAYRDLSQEELAREIGATLRTISRYENGAAPSRTYLDKLSRACGDREDLRRVFDGAKKELIGRSLSTLASSGAARRIKRSELLNLRETTAAVQDELLRIGDVLEMWSDFLFAVAGSEASIVAESNTTGRSPSRGEVGMIRQLCIRWISSLPERTLARNGGTELFDYFRNATSGAVVDLDRAKAEISEMLSFFDLWTQSPE